MTAEDGSRHVLIGQSARMRSVVKLIGKLGVSRWPVLLLGETGTGKEVVARSIHRANPTGPFVTIDCSALVGPLMESELFGYAKGAFTGAAAAKTGLIELADGGTAFFDEIGELPLDLQVKLLRVLQEKEFRPVGSLVQRRSDFRIVAATNRDLGKEVEKGTFRRDLYYRLNVVTMRLAPLRDRREDIPLLLQHFLERYGRQHTLAPEALEAILAYDWPGNIRELENSVQHMIAVNSGPLLHLRDLPSPIQNHMPLGRGRTMTAVAGVTGPALVSAGPGMSMPGLAVQSWDSAEAPVRQPAPVEAIGRKRIRTLAEVEREAILEALEYTAGDRAVAAHLLGIGRTTLYRKLKEYRLED